MYLIIKIKLKSGFNSADMNINSTDKNIVMVSCKFRKAKKIGDFKSAAVSTASSQTEVVQIRIRNTEYPDTKHRLLLKPLKPVRNCSELTNKLTKTL